MRDAVPAPKNISGSASLSGAKRLIRRHQAALGVLAALSLMGQIAIQPALRLPQTDAPKAAHALQHQKPYDTAIEAAVAASNQNAAYLTLLRGAEAGLCLLTLLAALGLAGSAQSGSAGRIVAELDAAEEKQSEISAALSEADRQIAQMRQTLENLSTVDALTGLKNHRAFQEQLDRELGRALRHNHPLSLLLLDVDQFKAYNDSYGHTEGDRALKLISGVLGDTARASDIPARYGGKEFAIILTETDMMGAVVLGERLRQAVAAADGLQRPLTASIGITTLTPMVFSAAEFVGQAENALSHAKDDGRNRVTHAHRIPEALKDEAPIYARAA